MRKYSQRQRASSPCKCAIFTDISKKGVEVEENDALDEAIKEMEFIEKCNEAREELRKELRLKLKDLIERLSRKIKEEELVEKVYSP